MSGSSVILRILSFFTRMPYVFPLFLMFFIFALIFRLIDWRSKL